MTREEIEKIAQLEAMRSELKRLVKSEWVGTSECSVLLQISKRTLMRIKPRLRLGVHYRWRGLSKQMGLEWHWQNIDKWMRKYGN